MRRCHVVGAREHGLDPLSAHLGLQLVGGSVSDLVTSVNDDDVIGQPLGLLHVLGREQNRRSTSHELLDRPPHLNATTRVESGRRLVEEDDLGLCDEGCGEVEATPHASGVGLRGAIGSVLQIESIQQRPRPLPGWFLSEMVETSNHVEVLETGQVLVDRRVLPTEPDTFTNPIRLGENIESCDLDLALIRNQQRGEDPDSSRLSGAVRAQQSQNRSLRNVQIETVEGDDVAVLLNQTLGTNHVGQWPSLSLSVIFCKDCRAKQNSSAPRDFLAPLPRKM